MHRYCFVGLVVSTLLVSGTTLAAEDATDVLSIEELVAAVNDRAAQLGETLRTKREFERAMQVRTISRGAEVIAVLAQTLAKHERARESKINFAGLREAALNLRRGKTRDDVRRHLERIDAALDGKGDAPESEVEWSQLISLQRLMKEIEQSQGGLRSELRRARNLPEKSVDATVVAALARALEADTHEVDDKADIPQWVAFAKTYRESMTRLAAAMRADDAEKSREIFYATGRTCTACHEKFRN